MSAGGEDATRAVGRDAAPGEVRAIAFHLPQFHPTPENDRWWGKGFTEWTNVARTTPRFPGHLQPHVPADLGFYDLRLPEARTAQAELAREYGIHAFCYFHYWFEGRRLLERPFEEILASGKPDFPFCLCWANENWTNRWVGRKEEMLVEQTYSEADDEEHIAWLIGAFRDPRYLTLHGRPLLLIYDAHGLPDATALAARWRERATQAGLPGLFLASVQLGRNADAPPPEGFDAAVEFPPGKVSRIPRLRPWPSRLKKRLGLSEHDPYLRDNVRSYEAMVELALSGPDPAYKRFPGVTPGWDNSPRRPHGANIFVGSTPELFAHWTQGALEACRRRMEGEERLLFVNAWNEWAEGNHLEPDLRHGRGYLEVFRAALHGR